MNVLDLPGPMRVPLALSELNIYVRQYRQFGTL